MHQQSACPHADIKQKSIAHLQIDGVLMSSPETHPLPRCACARSTDQIAFRGAHQSCMALAPHQPAAHSAESAMVKQPQAPLVEGHMPLANPRAHSCWSQETADSGAYLSCRVFRWGCCCEEADGVRSRLVGQQVLPRRKAGQLPQHRGHQPPDRGRLQPRRSGAVQQLLGRESLVPEELAAVHTHMPHLRSRIQGLGPRSLRKSVQACTKTIYKSVRATHAAYWHLPHRKS